MATNLPLPGMPGPQDQMDAVAPGQEAAPAPEVFDLTVGKYDLVVQAGPSFTTRREETAAALTEAMRGNPQFSAVLGPLLLKTLDVPGIEEISKKIEALAAQSAPQDPAKVKMAEMAAQLEADKAKAQSDFVLAQQKLQNDAMLAQQKAAADAALARQKAEADHALAQQKAEADHALAQQRAVWEAQLEAWKAGQAVERDITSSQERAAKVPNPDKDIAMLVAQAVRDGLSQVQLNVAMPRIKRRAIRDQSGLIIDMIEEPIDDAPPAGATLQ